MLWILAPKLSEYKLVAVDSQRRHFFSTCLPLISRSNWEKQSAKAVSVGHTSTRLTHGGVVLGEWAALCVSPGGALTLSSLQLHLTCPDFSSGSPLGSSFLSAFLLFPSLEQVLRFHQLNQAFKNALFFSLILCTILHVLYWKGSPWTFRLPHCSKLARDDS